MHRKLLTGLAIGGSAAALAFAASFLGALDRLEYVPWSWWVKQGSRPSPSTAKIKLILLDQKSLDWAAQEQGLAWPWPREVYGPILDFCRRAGARAVAFDVLYTESSDQESVAQDVALGEAVRRAPPFVGAVFLGRSTTQATHWPAAVPRPAWGDATEALRRYPALRDEAAAFPVLPVATSATVLANVKDLPDPDGIFRRASPMRVFDGVVLPSLGLGARLAAAPREKIEVGDGVLRVGEARIPLDARGRAILRFRGPAHTHEAFSAAAVIQSELKLQENEPGSVDPSRLKDCYVFFGFSAPGLKDLRPTPVSGDYPGVEIHATFLDNLLERDFLRDAPRAAVALFVLALALAAATATLHGRKVWHSVACIAGFSLAPLLAGWAGYGAGWWWPVWPGLVAAALALTGAVVTNYATEGRQRRFIKSAFKQYLSEEVIEILQEHPDQLKLGGEKRELTMFFSDLEKFSSFSERLEPPVLTALLNDFFTDMSEIIREEGGTLDKYVGDAIVAFWNAPLSQPDHAVRACRAAVRCQRRTAERRAEWQGRYDAVIRMRIGLNTGEVVVGNLGSNVRFNYTMLGDAANLASRLEGSNKAFGTFLMASESTWLAAQVAVTGRELGALRVVGRKAPVRVYEILGLAGEPRPAWVERYEEGLAHVRAGRWDEARTAFEAAPDDPASRLYAAKCREAAAGAGWDGVWNLTEK